MKTKEELAALKAETEEMKNKLAGLTDEELTRVSGGVGDFSVIGSYLCPFCNAKHDFNLTMSLGGWHVDQTWDCDRVLNTVLDGMSLTGNSSCPVTGTVILIPRTEYGSAKCVPFTTRIGL